MREELDHVGARYVQSANEPFGAHPIARFIRTQAADAVADALREKFPQYLVEGSPGKGRWAEVPWIAVFDPAVTDSATYGFYVVYLFSSAADYLFLSLNQGTTAVRSEFKGRTHEVLQDRARFMRARLADHVSPFSAEPISLTSSAILPRDYEAGHIIGKRYNVTQLPSEQEMRSELLALIGIYQRLVYLGGYDSTPEEDRDPVQEERPQATSIDERRQYRLHRALERRGKTSELVKRHHGTRCRACGLSFAELYGHLGDGYIEAHHLRPLSSLRPGEIVTYDIASDFCVLCANCHRMIHRLADPSDLDELRRRILV